MNGHQAIIDMRRKGLKPVRVYISDYPCRTDWAKWGDVPDVCIAGDIPELQDFRFLIGTTAWVDGSDKDRVQRIAKACAAHAKRVVSTVFKRIDAYQLETVSITDTDEVLTWPK